MVRRSLQALLSVCLLASLATAQRINFEVLPGGSTRPADGMPIDNHWRGSPHFLHFMLEGAGTPMVPQIAWAGGPATAFDGVLGGSCDVNSADMPLSSLNADCTFLTDDGIAGAGGRPRTIRIQYNQPVMEASGILLDVDGVESYRIEALDESGAAIAGVFMDVDATSPGSGNGLATPWALATGDPSKPIFTVRMEYTGPTTGAMGDGLSFDNFAPSTICPDRIEHRGGGLAGGNGRLARISPGCPAVGNPGSINIFNAPGGAFFCLIISPATSFRAFGTCGSADTVIDMPGVIMREAILNGPFGIAGAGSISLPFGPLQATFGNGAYHIQAAFVDPAVACGFSLSEVVSVKIP